MDSPASLPLTSGRRIFTSFLYVPPRRAFPHSIRSRCQLYCGFSQPCFPPNGKKQETYSTFSSDFFQRIRCWRRLALSRGRNLQISARWRTRIRRQNTLRGKITRDGTVTRDPQVSNSDPNFEKLEYLHTGTDKNGFNLDNGIAEKSSLDFVHERAVSEDSNLGMKQVSNYPNSQSKLDNWVNQYKKEPVTSIYEDFEKKIIGMVLNGEEIYGCKVRKLSAEDSATVDETPELNFNFTSAKEIKEGIDKDNLTVPESSSVDNTISGREKSPFMNMVHSISRMKIRMPTRGNFPLIGCTLLIALCVSWAVARAVLFKNRGKLLKEIEMLKRKKADIMKREEVGWGKVEVLDSVPEIPSISVERPPLDRGKLMDNISRAKVIDVNSVKDRFSGKLTSAYCSGDKVREIREMVRKVHELEGQNSNQKSEGSKRGKTMATDGRTDLYVNQKEENMLDSGRKEAFEEKYNSGQKNSSQTRRSVHINDEIILYRYQEVEKKSDPGRERASEEKRKPNLNNLKGKVKPLSGRNKNGNDKEQLDGVTSPLNGSTEGETTKHSKMKTSVPKEEKPKTFGTKSSGKTKLRIIKSVQEAKEYLVKKNKVPPGKEKDNQKNHIKDADDSKIQNEKNVEDKNSQNLLNSLQHLETSDSRPVSNNGNMNGLDGNSTVDISSGASSATANSSTTPEDNNESLHGPGYLGKQKEHQSVNDASNSPSEVKDQCKQEETKHWADKYEDELKPVISKISKGFQENFTNSREHPKDITLSDLRELVGQDSELDWLKDEKLSAIVFKVRDNELTGKDPFHNLEESEKQAFFKGLEKKIERFNEKLLPLHQYLHSKIENLDYGADGISVYDPLEKMIPRWKGPAFEKDLEFLDKPLKQKKTSCDKIVGKTKDLVKSKGTSPYSPIVREKGSSDKNKTVIESSDGTNRPGKKGGKEQWQHTKKWSQGFLDVYNSQMDPEVKLVLKEMGKDLDRWITEEELQQKQSLKEKMFKKRRKFVEKKMGKLKREVEKYGAAAVVSKYREYADTKEEDYLWWLDLPYVLCIELYMMEEGSPRVGLYALEMAADLELEPKQKHVIGFQDSHDAKNFCYIIQNQMEMMGTGNAFVVTRPPKEAFKEAKSEGFNVTVIKKGEIKLNIDQTLDEVEGEIIEIGSKMYHDMIMRERSFDVGTIMKGLVRAEKLAKQ